MPVIENRPFHKIVAGIALACAIPAIAACDRQSAGGEQPASTAPATPAPAGSGTGSAEAFTGKLDTTHKGQPLPAVTIALPDGTKQALAAFKGKPLLVNLWATWCGPCVLEMPMLDTVARREAGKLQVVVVSQDLQGAEVVAPWFDDKGFTDLKPWLDPENELGFALGTGVLPTTVLYDAEGREVWRMVGGYEWSGREATALLAKSLNGSD